MTQRVDCPFGPCQAVVEAYEVPDYPKPGGQPAHVLIQGHQIKDGSVICPASFMHYPLTIHELERLGEQYQAFMPDHGPYPVQVSGTEGSVGGRTTDAASDCSSWALGGREDEDIIPENEHKTGVVPSGVHGTQVGRGSGMASIPEVLSMLNASTIAGAEATEALAQCQEATERARSAIAEVLSTSRSDSLNSALSHYGWVLDDIGKCIVALHEAGEYTERYMQNLQS